MRRSVSHRPAPRHCLTRTRGRSRRDARQRMSLPSRQAASLGVALALVVAVLVACTSTAAQDPSGAALDAEALDRLEEIRSQPGFDAARKAYAGCMIGAGYKDFTGEPGSSVTLTDGSVFRSPVPGGMYVITDAEAVFREASTSCLVSSGIGPLLPEVVLERPMPPESELAAGDADMVKVSGCLIAAGWDIPEPTTLPNGHLVVQITFDGWTDADFARFSEAIRECRSS